MMDNELVKASWAMRGRAAREWRTWAHASQEMMPQAKPDSAPLTAPARVALFLQMS